jgi:hypothetical protein
VSKNTSDTQFLTTEDRKEEEEAEEEEKSREERKTEGRTWARR